MSETITPDTEPASGYRTNKAHFPGCVERWCFFDNANRHGHCADCDRFTCNRALRIDPTTLRRRVVPVCDRCYFQRDPEQDRLKEERTRNDWRLLTDPIVSGLIKPGEMPEQLPSTARAVLRAFFETPDIETAVIPDVDAGVLNASIASLGLGELMYAETRSQHTVLRRVAADR